MRVVIITLLTLLITFEVANASDVPPTSRITLQSPARSELIGYTGESLTFSSSTTSANCGTITARQWKLDGSEVSTSITYTNTFTLPAGVYEQTYTLTLTTWNSCGGLYDVETQTLTIRRDQRVYFVKDHLGSVRATVNEAGDVIGYDDYYPFGLTMPGRSSNSANPNDNYKFIGEELDDEAGLNVMHLNARSFDTVIARFMQVDPMYDLYPSWNPFHYSFNNPIRWVDPTGNCPEDGSEGDAGDGDGYCLAEIQVTATQLPWIVHVNYVRPSYFGAFASFAARTAPVTQADGAVLPFADFFYTGLLLGKIGTTIYDAATFTDSETFEIMLNSEGAKTVEDLLEGAEAGQRTKGKTENWEKEGGMEQANEDFDSLGLTDVKPIPGGRVGTLPNGGGKVNVRDRSSDGRPTIEVQRPNGRRTKIRYN